MEETIIAFNEIMVRATVALESAIKDYGPDAVDLALAVYKVEGIKGTAVASIAFLFAIGIIYLTVIFLKFCIKLFKGGDEEAAVLSALFGSCILALAVVICLGICVSKAYHIAAAFGYPEILIVYKALSAAGLM